MATNYKGKFYPSPGVLSQSGSEYKKKGIRFSVYLMVLYMMVADFTMRIYGVYQAIRFVEGIWFNRKSR